MNSALPVIDPDVLDELLACDPSGDLLRELIDVYLDDTPPRLDALHRALLAGDPRALADQAHALKSSCAQLGAMQLSDRCRQLERIGRDGGLAGAEPLVAALLEEFPRVRTDLLARRSG